MERERLIRKFGAGLRQLEIDNDVFLQSLLEIRPSDVTPESWADMQAKADDLFQSFRRCVKALNEMWRLTEPPWWDESEPPRIPMDD